MLGWLWFMLCVRLNGEREKCPLPLLEVDKCGIYPPAMKCFSFSGTLFSGTLFSRPVGNPRNQRLWPYWIGVSHPLRSPPSVMCDKQPWVVDSPWGLCLLCPVQTMTVPCVEKKLQTSLLQLQLSYFHTWCFCKRDRFFFLPACWQLQLGKHTTVCVGFSLGPNSTQVKKMVWRGQAKKPFVHEHHGHYPDWVLHAGEWRRCTYHTAWGP